jgi:hypothetical protein
MYEYKILSTYCRLSDKVMGLKDDILISSHQQTENNQEESQKGLRHNINPEFRHLSVGKIIGYTSDYFFKIIINT